MASKKYTNALIHETSPYLLQHAHNPVDWRAWNDETLAIAKRENKLLIISIGYSACHWCHVMEHESFEDEAVAKLMNTHFLPIKVDREERPDIDDVYMTACQMITGRGGWPLNAIALPDGRPIWAGTYFPKEKWMEILEQFRKIQQVQPSKLEDAARSIINSMETAMKENTNSGKSLTEDNMAQLVEDFLSIIDYQHGGRRGAPKFPMPSNWMLLMEYNALHPKEKISTALEVTLLGMARGGIFDHLEGGFARYAVDSRWLVPHFEKMLYDNAQLLSVYSKAYNHTGQEIYKTTIDKTVQFARGNWLDETGGWYAALDADSEGVEGKYYVWSAEEIDAVLENPIERKFFKSYYGITPSGNWEGKNILEIHQYQPNTADSELNQELKEIIRKAENKLLKHRNQRVKPGLDDKILTAWNGLMVTGLIDAYTAIKDDSFLALAEHTLKFLLSKVRREDGGLFRNYKNGHATINGFLDDYAYVIQACIDFYEISGQVKYLEEADQLAEYVLNHFQDDTSPLLYYTSDLDHQLVIRKKETTDNVIPASNSAIAFNLSRLSVLLDRSTYGQRSKEMLHQMASEITGTGQLAYHSNWLRVALYQEALEIVVMGEDFKNTIRRLKRATNRPAIFMGHTHEEVLPYMSGRGSVKETTIYVCQNRACQLPTTDIEEAIKIIERV